jgi:hypothetical protein
MTVWCRQRRIQPTPYEDILTTTPIFERHSPVSRPVDNRATGMIARLAYAWLIVTEILELALYIPIWRFYHHSNSAMRLQPQI